MGHERKQHSGLIPIDSGVTKLARRGDVVVDVEQTGRTLEEAQLLRCSSISELHVILERCVICVACR